MKKVLSFVLALCLICTLLPATALTAKAADGEYVKTDLADIQSTDVVVITMTKGSTTWALYNGNGTSKAPTATVVTVSGDKITSDVADTLKWNISNNDETLTIYPNGTTSSWLYCTSSNNGVRVGTNANKAFTIDASSGYLKNTATSRYVGVYTTNPDWRCYTNTTGNTAGQTLAFYVLSQGGSSEPECDHANIAPVGVNKDATCTEPGSVAGEKCTACGEVLVEEETIKALGHNYVDGICSRCGEEQPNEVEATLTFDNTSKRTAYTTSIQVWEENGITATNNKASSTTNIADYSNPARFYANSSLTVESSEGNISKIVFDCNSTTYANALKTSIGNVSGATVTVSSDKVTVEFDEAVESFTIAKLSEGQVRMDALTVTSVKAGDASCPHTNTEILPAEAPTCTEDGLKKGWVCTDCGYEEQEVDPKTGHNLVDGEAKEATCTETGLTAGKYCTKCDYTEQEVIPAGHKYVNGVCSGCGQELPNEATITFDDTSKRTEFTTSQQVWLENGITVTNEKGSSNTMGDYCNPVRFYKNSNLTIAYPAAMCQIIFDCNSGSYANAMAAAITDGTVTVNSDKVIFVPTTPAESVTFTLTEDQVRMDSITVICNVAEFEDGTRYTSLEAALDDEDGVIKLLVDLTATDLNLDANDILDLNGKTLTAGAIAGTVMDSTDGEGLVKVAKESAAVLSSVDGQLLLWDNNVSGYRVYEYSFNDRGVDADGTDTDETAKSGGTVVSFWSDLDFDESYAYQLVASTVSGLNVGFKLELNGVEKTFWLSEENKAEILKKWGESKYSNTNAEIDYFFYVTVTGFAALQEDGVLKVTPVVQDYYGKVIEASAIEYEFIAG